MTEVASNIHVPRIAYHWGSSRMRSLFHDRQGYAYHTLADVCRRGFRFEKRLREIGVGSKENSVRLMRETSCFLIDRIVEDSERPDRGTGHDIH